MSKQSEELEIELKLTGDPASLESAWDHLIAASAGDGAVQQQRLAATYYDTPDRRLRQREGALRIRTEGAHIVQTLKAPTATRHALRRREWHARLQRPEPDLHAFKRPAARRVVADLANLAPVFETDVSRRTAIIRPNAAGRSKGVIAAAFDLGEIKANGAAAPLSEIELELMEGDPAVIYDLALVLSQQPSLNVETRTKWSRGWDLANGTPPAWHKARRIELQRSMSVDAAVAAILANCFAQCLANQAAAIDGGDPEGVHQLRVALRRLRTALSIFRKILGPDATAWIKTEARWTLQALGAARDWDVFIHERVAPMAASRPGDRGLAALRRATEGMRDQAYEQVREVLTSARYTQFLLRLGAWIERHEWRAAAGAKLDKPIPSFARRWLTKSRDDILAAGYGFADLPVADRHRIRLALKKFRYASEFFRTLYPPKRTARYVGRLRALQDTLGHLNDLSTAEHLVGQLLAQPRRRVAAGQLQYSVGFVLGWCEHQARPALRDGSAEWQDFVRAKPYWE